MRQLTSPPFVVENAEAQRKRAIGVELLLDWLAGKPGGTWQERWLSVEADVGGRAWRQVGTTWLADSRHRASWHQDFVAVALRMAISVEVVRPSLTWLLSGAMGQGSLARFLVASRDPEGFARLGAHCDANPEVSARATTRMMYRSALIMAAKGGLLSEITVGDVVELLDAEAEVHGRTGDGSTLFYRTLHEMGVFGHEAPSTLRHFRTTGQRSPEELIDRYNFACRPVRDLLVDYLKERQPALDYNSLETLANRLGERFWADLEAHHPGIDSLRLPVEVASAWKQRLRTMSKKVRTATGERAVVVVPRLSYRECLTPVRSLYLDLAHWAVEDPERWGAWVAPCPVGEAEVDLRKGARQRKSRMDQRTRERLPALPSLVRAVDEARKATAMSLEAGRRAEPGEVFSLAGSTFVRRARADGIWVDDLATGEARNFSLEEGRAFWAWATIEVLRHTGIRIEELLELSHHSLVQYRLPTTGELIPLLQIVPSKTDAERLVVVSPELAEVLSVIICRSRDSAGAVPFVSAYDDYERVWLPPAPRLFQRRINGENRAFAHSTILKILTAAAARSGLVDPVEGRPLHYTPHDFRRMFITDAILNGLPPHIAQVIAGHQDINVTLGYKAVYPEEAIQAHLLFLARRRALRPSEEYRTPTDEEWQEFLGHFERRKVSIGTCARAFGTPCIHEHACVRCPMLWPDPAQRARLAEIRQNLTARIVEAERQGWLGEVEGLQVSLAGAEDKLAQIDRHTGTQAVDFGPRARIAINA
jgi:integrase